MKLVAILKMLMSICTKKHRFVPVKCGYCMNYKSEKKTNWSHDYLIIIHATVPSYTANPNISLDELYFFNLWHILSSRQCSDAISMDLIFLTYWRKEDRSYIAKSHCISWNLLYLLCASFQVYITLIRILINVILKFFLKIKTNE